MDRAKDIEENGKEYNRPDFLVADGSVINTGPRDAGTEGPEKMPSDKGSKQGRNKNFLVVYAMTLLSIAFVLVLLSYLSTMRANNSQIESLRPGLMKKSHRKRDEKHTRAFRMKTRS